MLEHRMRRRAGQISPVAIQRVSVIGAPTFSIWPGERRRYARGCIVALFTGGRHRHHLAGRDLLLPGYSGLDRTTQDSRRRIGLDVQADWDNATIASSAQGQGSWRISDRLLRHGDRLSVHDVAVGTHGDHTYAIHVRPCDSSGQRRAQTPLAARSRSTAGAMATERHPRRGISSLEHHWPLAACGLLGCVVKWCVFGESLQSVTQRVVTACGFPPRRLWADRP
jgi:hypothetical protein